MPDPNFQRTVVLLVEHGDGGTLGFVLNRKLKAGIHEIVEDLPPFGSSVLMGGPVEQNTLHYVHRLGEKLPGSREIIPGLYWGGEFEILKQMVRSEAVSEDDILFFVGYSGWGEGQLDDELERKSWIIAPQDADFVFEPYAEVMWKKLLSSLGDKYKMISNYPVDPSLN